MQHNYKRLISRLWFLVNLLVSLYPPLYWQVGASQQLILGMPVSFIYFIAISISITLSIIFAYQEEASREGWK